MATGLEIMSEHSPEDFPPHWDPPPRLGFRENDLALVDILEAMAQTKPATWVQKVYLEKLKAFLSHRRGFGRTDDEELARIFQNIKRLPEGPKVLERWETDPEFKERYRQVYIPPQEKDKNGEDSRSRDDP